MSVSRSVGRYLAQLAIVFGAQFAAGKLGDVLQTLNMGGIGPVWPGAGIAVGALLICGYSVWPGVAAGAFLLAFSSPLPGGAAAVYAAGTTLAALFAVFLLRRIAGFDHSLSRLRDVVALIVLGAFGSGVLSASIGASTLYAAHIRGWSGFRPAWLIYWLGDSTGVLVVTPLVLTLPTLFRTRDRHRLTEFAGLLLLLTVTSFAAFGLLPFNPGRVHHMAFAVLPFVMWAAIRFGMSVTALSIFLIAIIATAETALGSGPFTTNTPLINAVLLDAFFAVISVTGLTLAAAISEREQAERERERLVRERAEAETRLRFAAIVESSDDAIVSKTLEGVVVSWNKGAQQIYGYTETEAVGTSVNILVPPELVEEENEILEKLRAGERIEHFETIRVTKTGEKINISLTLSPIKDSSGKTVGISGIARDITERKQAEEALRASEGRLRLAQQAAGIGTFERDVRTGRITWAEGLEPLYGLPPGSVDGKTPTFFKDLIHPADRERVAHLIQQALNTGQPTEGEWRAIWPDGSVHWIVSRWQVLMDDAGEPSRVVGVNMDVTARKLAEETLRASEEKFRSVFRDAGVGMVIVSPEGRFLAANSAFCDCLGFTEEELLQKTVESVTFPEDWPALSQKLRETLTEGRGFQWFEKRCLHKSGRIVYTESSASVIRSREGDPQYLVGQVLDITERKEAEEALADMSRKLIAAQEQERARIARELHDDINQRLAMLAVELEQLQDNPAEVRSRLQELRQQTTEISNDVQTLSHELHSSKLEYLGMVAGMKSWCKELAERQGMQIDFRHDVQRTLPPEIGLSLFRVLQEALHNAAKHSGVKRIEVQLREDSGEIHLIVHDLGRGFDIEAARQGRGLGLTSMRERIRLVNGTIDIQSTPMGGTTIHARVPFPSEQIQQRQAV